MKEYLNPEFQIILIQSTDVVSVSLPEDTSDDIDW